MKRTSKMEKITYIELPESKPSKKILEDVKYIAEHMFYNSITFPYIVGDINEISDWILYNR